MLRALSLPGSRSCLSAARQWWAAASCTQGLPEPVAGRVRAHQLRALLKVNALMTAATTIIALVVAYKLHRSAPLSVGVWMFAVLLFFAGQVRILLKRRGPPPRTASARTIRRAERAAVNLAVIWGSPPALFLPYATLDQRFVVIQISIGMLFCGALALASIPRAAITYAGLTVLLFVAFLLTRSLETALTIIPILLTFLAIICGTIVTLGRQAAQHVADQQLISDAAAEQKRLRDEMRRREARARMLASAVTTHR